MLACCHRPLINVSCLVALLATTSYASAQELSASGLYKFPKVSSSEYGVRPDSPGRNITVNDDQTCNSRSSGTGGVVATFDRRAFLCLSGQGFALYDLGKKALFSSQEQVVIPGSYGTRKADADGVITVISRSKCFSQASGPGLTVVVPKRTEGPLRRDKTLYCISTLGKGYTLYRFSNGSGVTASSDEEERMAKDPTEIRYEVGSKILSFLTDYIPQPSRIPPTRSIKR